MKWKAVFIAAICFGAGLVTGFFFFQRSSPSERQMPAAADHAFGSPTKSPAAIPLTTSNREANTVFAENSTDQTSAVADLQRAVHDARSMWDLSGIFRAIDGLNTNQFGEAIAACFKTTNLQTVAYAIRELGARWGRIDPQKALAFASVWGNSSQRPLVIAGILSGWAENDPNAATTYAKSLPDGQAKSEALAAVAGTIAFDNPKSAFDLVKNLSPGYLQTRLIWPIFSQWADRSPSDAAAAALQIPANSFQAAGVVANVWAIKDFDAAYAWAASLPPGGMRDEAIKRAMWTLASGDLDAAAVWINQHSTDPDVNGAAFTLGNALADMKPAATVTWIRSLPEGPASKERDSQYQVLASTWARLDLAGVNKWVDNLPAGQFQDQVARPVAEELSESDPATAARLLDTIQNDFTWQLTAPQIANRWLKSDPKAAKKWVAQSALPEDFKQNFANEKP